jgi:hypothetical protein
VLQRLNPLPSAAVVLAAAAEFSPLLLLETQCMESSRRQRSSGRADLPKMLLLQAFQSLLLEPPPVSLSCVFARSRTRARRRLRGRRQQRNAAQVWAGTMPRRFVATQYGAMLSLSFLNESGKPKLKLNINGSTASGSGSKTVAAVRLPAPGAYHTTLQSILLRTAFFGAIIPACSMQPLSNRLLCCHSQSAT